ncbi:MAG: hypothetical protein AAGF93_21500 [Cyanobacteria bacterium P01_H01_bin.105]
MLSCQAEAQDKVLWKADVASQSYSLEVAKSISTDIQSVTPFTYLAPEERLIGNQTSETFIPLPKLIESSERTCRCHEQPSARLFQIPIDDEKNRDISLDMEEEDEEPQQEQQTETNDTEHEIDDELGILRVRSQPVGIDSELGILRIRPTEDVPLEVEPEPTRQTTVFLTGRANVFGGNNLFRTPNPIDDRIYQTGVGVFAFPSIASGTNLLLSAEANIARYEDLSVVDYNEIQFQAGIRQRLSRNSYGQINWRHQDLSSPGSESFFTANYVELLLSRRDILNNHTWLDSYYQARLSISDPKAFSRFTQIATGSLNYGFDAQTRVSLLYQLFIDDYTEISRHDTYHQVLAQVSHDLSDTTRLSLFTGFRFGRSSLSSVSFDDTIYGASVNVSLPLF